MYTCVIYLIYKIVNCLSHQNLACVNMTESLYVCFRYTLPYFFHYVHIKNTFRLPTLTD